VCRRTARPSPPWGRPTASRRSWERQCATATAVPRSPWPPCAQMPITPMGAVSSGDGSVMPNSSTDMSRRDALTNPRDRPHRPKASTLACWVCSVAAPPPRRTAPAAAGPGRRGPLARRTPWGNSAAPRATRQRKSAAGSYRGLPMTIMTAAVPSDARAVPLSGPGILTSCS
jgi:hypothetical protein